MILKEIFQNQLIFHSICQEASRQETKNIGKLSIADDRQGIVLPVVGGPFLAATVPLAAASAVGVYGAYGDVIIEFLNSLIGQ